MTAVARSSKPAWRADRWDARHWGILLVVCGAMFLDGLDLSMIGVALPSIRADLHLSTPQLQWVVSGYVLGYGGLMLLGGRAADLLGRRRVFVAAISVFAVASVLGAWADDPALLVALRFVKGASAAFTAPAGFSIVTTTFREGPQRNRALGIFAAANATGFSAGLIAGGLMTELGWRWTFLAPGPVALVIALAAPRLLEPDGPRAPLGRRFDLAGAVTMTVGMLLVVRAVVAAPAAGWGSLLTVGTFTVAALLLGLFVVIERRAAHPLVRLGILRSAMLVRANLAAMAMAGCYVSFMFVTTLFLQSGLGWSAMHMALAFLPLGLIVAFGAARVGPVVDRFGTARVLTVGFVAFVTGYALFLRVGTTPSYLVAVFPTMVLVGIGFVLVFPSSSIQATAGIADHEQGLASGLMQTSAQLGGAIVLAVVTAVVGSRTSPDANASELLEGMRIGLKIVLAVGLLGLIAAAGGIAHQRRPALPPCPAEL